MSARWGGVGVVVCLMGCPHQPASDAGVHDAPAPVDAGPPQPESVSIAVVDDRGPIAGALLYVDDANGMRHTATADGGGLATLADIPWTPGAISITAVAPDHPLHESQTLAGFRRSDLGDRADASGTITLRLIASVDLVQIRGNVLNANAADTVTLSTDVRGGLFPTGTTSFQGDVEPGVAFHVFALEGGFTMQGPQTETFVIRALLDIPHAAITADTSFDIDFDAAPEALDSASGIIVPPMDGTPLAHIYPDLTVTTDESQLQAVLGTATSLQVSDASIAYNAQFAHTIPGTPVTLLAIRATSGAYAQVALDGVPSGTLVSSSSAWPSPPILRTPANGGTAPLHDPIVFASVDASAPVVATLVLGSEIWLIDMPAGASTLVVPALPDALAATSASSVPIAVHGCTRWPGHHTACSRIAGGDFFTATLP